MVSIESHSGDSCLIDPFIPLKEGWLAIKNDVLTLEREAFRDHAYDDAELTYAFTNPENSIVLLRDRQTQKVVGYAYTVPIDHWHPERKLDHDDIVLVDNIVIGEKCRGQHLTGPMLSLLEKKMQDKQYKFFEINANIQNGLATNIEKEYKGRIVEGPTRTPIKDDEESGARMYFRIKL